MRALVLSLTVVLGWRSFWRGRRSRNKDGVTEVDPAEELRLKIAARKASPSSPFKAVSRPWRLIRKVPATISQSGRSNLRSPTRSSVVRMFTSVLAARWTNCVEPPLLVAVDEDLDRFERVIRDVNYVEIGCRDQSITDKSRPYPADKI